jgi:tRNA (cytidine/uridine-2'-O-)-methyltransferase
MRCMLHVVLYQPEIPGNTGSAIRLCANTGATLHLIEPLGFDMDDARLRRAGLDYHEYATVQRHRSLDAFRSAVAPARLLALSAHGTQRYDEVAYAAGDALLFGPESVGLPAELLTALPLARIPMRPANRSLNLANAVAVVVYEAWRQLGFVGS